MPKRHNRNRILKYQKKLKWQVFFSKHPPDTPSKIQCSVAVTSLPFPYSRGERTNTKWKRTGYCWSLHREVILLIACNYSLIFLIESKCAIYKFLINRNHLYCNV